MRDEIKQVFLNASEKQMTLAEKSIAISQLTDELNELNKDESFRSRELSLAVTNIEQGNLWLTAAIANMEDA